MLSFHCEKRCFQLGKNSLIDSLQIDNFRGLHDLTIDNLSQVNVFVGTNNCGKTSVLEAVKLLGAPDDVGQVIRIALQRAQASTESKKRNIVNYVLSIFQKTTDMDGQQDYYHIKLGVNAKARDYIYEADGTIGEAVDSTGATKGTLAIAIKTSVDGGKANYRSVEIVNGEDAKYTSTERPIYSSLYLPSSISYYRSCVVFLSNYIVREGQQEVLQILQTFDKNIDDISIVGEDIYLHNTHSGSMPLFAYGSGLQKAVLLTVAIAYCKNGVILVDEIDNAIHVTAFKDVFGWFLDACMRWDVQAFITTHSAEAIDAILEINHEKHLEDDVLRVITLRKDYKDNATRKKIRTGEEAYSDRERFKMELRV